MPALPLGPAGDLPSGVVGVAALESAAVGLGVGLPPEGEGVVAVAPEDGDEGLEVALLGLVAPMPVPIVDGPIPGPEGLCPPVVVIFCPKKPNAGRAWPN